MALTELNRLKWNYPHEDQDTTLKHRSGWSLGMLICWDTVENLFCIYSCFYLPIFFLQFHMNNSWIYVTLMITLLAVDCFP